MKFLKAVSKKSFLFTLTVLFMVSCAKDIDIFTPNGPIGNIDAFFSKVQSLSTTQEIMAETTFTIVTENETLIHIPDNAFVYLNGDNVQGNVDIEFIEVLDRSLMMLYKVPTVSGNDLLESDAVYYINATKEGQQLKLAEGKYIRFQIPNDDPDNLIQIFYGDEVNEEFNWRLSDPPQGWATLTINEWQWQDLPNSIFGFGYDFEINELNWINVDIFKDVPEDQRTDVCVELPEIYTNKNSIVFMVFNDFNSVVGFVGDPDEMNFCEPYGLTPIGFNVTFVVISEQGDGIYHFGTKGAVIEEHHREFMVPEEKTIEEILDIISQF